MSDQWVWHSSAVARDPIMQLLDKLDEMYAPLTDEEIEDGRREWMEITERLSLTLEPSSDSPESI